MFIVSDAGPKGQSDTGDVKGRRVYFHIWRQRPRETFMANLLHSLQNMFLVSDGDNHCIKAFDQSGTFLYKFGKEGNQDGQFDMPFGLLVDSSCNLLVCDLGNDRVRQFALDGRFTGKNITHLSRPMAITNAPDGCILVSSDY